MGATAEGPVDLGDMPTHLRDEVAQAERWRPLLAEAASDVTMAEAAKLMTTVRARCDACGTEVGFDRSGDALVARDACPVAGVTSHDVVLDVPSGRMVFADDLRDLVVTRTDADLGFGGIIGRMSVTRAYAEVGMAHVFVGNSCPEVRRRGKVIEVASGRQVSGGRRLGSVTTDLWWVSFMDRDHFLRRCAAEGRDPVGLADVDVRVEPGTYVVTDHLVIDRHGTRGSVFCTIRPSPVRVPLVEWVRPRDLPFPESHFARFRHGFDLHGSRAFLSHVFHVGGNGLSWVDGVPSLQTRADDAPFATLEGRRPYGHPRASEVPGIWSGIGRYGVPEISAFMPQFVGRLPLGVDAEWLAAALMVTRGVLDMGDADLRPDHDVEAVRASHRVVMDVLCELGEARGLFDGRLQALFPLVAAHVRGLPAAGSLDLS